MQVSVPPDGPELRELQTREDGEGHTMGCGLFSTPEKSTSRTKTLPPAQKPSIEFQPIETILVSGRDPLLGVSSPVRAKEIKCITMHNHCMPVPKKKAADSDSESTAQNLLYRSIPPSCCRLRCAAFQEGSDRAARDH